MSSFGGPDLSWSSVRRAVLFQDSSHLRLTVRQNVTLRPTGGDDDRVRAALAAAGLHAVIDALPAGLGTVVGAGFGGATDLSGGQWQRLALARLYYADAPVLICDEPSAGLDLRGEAELVARLRDLARDRFVFVVSHRSETIRACDQALVLDLGDVAWQGDPDEAVRHLSCRAHESATSTGSRGDQQERPPGHGPVTGRRAGWLRRPVRLGAARRCVAFRALRAAAHRGERAVSADRLRSGSRGRG